MTSSANCAQRSASVPIRIYSTFSLAKHSQTTTDEFTPRPLSSGQKPQKSIARVSQKNNAAVVHLTHLSDVADDPLNAYAFRRAAVRKALENDRLLAQLSIINPGAKDRTSLHYDAQELYTEAAAAARNVTFSVALPGASGNALREALTGMGFSEGNPATLAFSGTTEFEETDLQRRTLVFVRYRYTIEAVTQDQNLILSLHGSRREGHINFSEATARAQRSLRSELLSTVPRELGSYFDRITSAEQK